MSAMREKDQADFDLEAFIELFDEALTSDDPNVQKTLQHLMLICALARNHDGHSERRGPLRRMFEDIRHMNQRINTLEAGTGYRQGYGPIPTPYPGMPGTPAGPIWTAPSTGTQWPPLPGTFPPGTLFAQNLSSVSVTPPNSGAKSTTGHAWNPADASNIAKKLNGGIKIAERVEDLLKDEKYKGSTVGALDVKIS